MPAFIIVETDIQDPDQYERYKEATPAVIAAAGGRFVVRERGASVGLQRGPHPHLSCG